MPRAVIEVSIEIPNISLTSQIECNFPILVHDNNPIGGNLIVGELLYSINVILIVSDNIILNLENHLAIGI